MHFLARGGVDAGLASVSVIDETAGFRIFLQDGYSALATQVALDGDSALGEAVDPIVGFITLIKANGAHVFGSGAAYNLR